MEEYMSKSFLFISTLLCSGIFTTQTAAQNISDQTLTGTNVYGAGMNVQSPTGHANNITSNFSNNKLIQQGESGEAQGAALYVKNTSIDLVQGDFTGNTINADNTGCGSAIYFESDNNAQIGTVSGKFYNNSTFANKTVHAGAIDIKNVEIKNITGEFINNLVKSENLHAQGGAIRNEGIIHNINALFKENKAEGNTGETSHESAVGGAIDNSGTINSISGKFINNHAFNEDGSGTVRGGAIANNYKIGSINADFSENHARSVHRAAKGGAIANYDATIGHIRGNFTDNFALSDITEVATSDNKKGYADGGAILNQHGTITSITGNFTGNYVSSGNERASGGAINNNTNGIIKEGLIGNFKNNYAKTTGDGKLARGGAILNVGSIEFLQGNFEGNYAESTRGRAIGGALATFESSNKNSYLKPITNSNFIGNYVIGDSTSTGGAIYSALDLLILADNGTSHFKNNYVIANGKRINNAIYMENNNLLTLELVAANNGSLIFDDEIDGKKYNVSLNGDGTGMVRINNYVKNINDFYVTPTAMLNLGVNGHIETTNMYINSASAVPENLLSPDNTNNLTYAPTIKVDVNVDKKANTVTTGSITAKGDVIGDYNVIVNALSSDVLPNKEDAIVPFVFAPNDNLDTPTDFTVTRVIGSPYMWESKVNVKGDETGSTWYLNLTDEENPDYVEPELTPETEAGANLPSAGIEQTRSVVRNVSKNVESSRRHHFGYATHKWQPHLLYNAWAVAEVEGAQIDKGADIDAKIWGIESGIDYQKDIYNTFGTFVSFRQGRYDLKTRVKSDIKIDSYLGGFYYRFNKDMHRVFATIYGGTQQTRTKTDDKIAKFKTDGFEAGAGIEYGYKYALKNQWFVEPTVSAYYNWIKYDDAHDNVGKDYHWDDIHYAEFEFGPKITKDFKDGNVYIKPSVIQALITGNKVEVSGLSINDKSDNYTLGRIEAGGRYDFNNTLSSYGWTNYTFGSGYQSVAAGIGLSYAW